MFVLRRWLSRLSLERIEPVVPVVLGAHGVATRLIVPVPTPVLAVFLGVALLGVLGLAGWCSTRAVVVRAVTVLAVAVVLQTAEPQLVPSLLQWYYCVAAVYAVLLTGRAAAVIGPATAGCYLLQNALADPPMPWELTGLRAGVLSALGVVMYVAGRSYRQERHNAVLRQDVAEAAGQQLEHLATHDALTGLPNRRLLLRELASAIGAPGDGCLGVLILDIDRFKTINDSLGHQAGDQMLVDAAQRLQQDQPHRLIARLGGDEFAILVQEADGAAVERVAASIVSSVRPPFAVAQRAHQVTASVGVALLGSDRRTALDLIRAADVAMYRAKSAGRDRYVVHDEGMAVQAALLMSLEQDLRRAVREGDIWMAFQPIIDLHTGETQGVEALARWTPRTGPVPPDVFVSLAEEMGLINDLGAHVLEESLSAMSRFRSAGLEIGTIAVNVSPLQLSDGHFPPLVAARLRALDLPPSTLTLELTENALMATPEPFVANLDALRAMGVRISLDDFGTGYSSLARLRRLPVAEVKIDRSFVAELGQDDTVARTVLSLARNLDLHTVAEGVETVDQLRRLRLLGCDAAQGYYLGRPMTEPDLLAWYRTTRGTRTATPSPA